MTITIQTDEATITLDNNFMMADDGNITYGEIRKDICIDGEVTKAQAKKIILEYLKEFVK